MYQTTIKDFELFTKECNKWLIKFQLNNWYVKFEHKYLEKGQANCVANYKAMNACISLNKQCEGQLPPPEGGGLLASF